MSYLDKHEADRIVTDKELAVIGPKIDKHSLAIRCNHGRTFEGGAGFNLDTSKYGDNIKYATALYAAICFAQDTIHEKMDEYYLLLMRECALGGGETYQYRQGNDIYTTLPKCSALGGDAQIVTDWRINDSAIKLARYVVERILGM
jgi:hypothetical protein